MHQAVLLDEILENLNLAPGKKILDCTVGGGGHARAILERITPSGSLIGIDQDEDALKAASDNLREFKDNINLVHGNFKDLDSILSKLKRGKFDGVLFDLGLCSLQLEEKERGFSIKLDGPLDMRMDRSIKMDAAYLVNKLDEKRLAQTLRVFGEERYSKRIARAIVAKRPIGTTGKLAGIVSKAVPSRYRYGRIHPATRTFQALRIAVNNELASLEIALEKVIRFIERGGRICVISFHSLEDRIVKRSFLDYKKKGLLKILTKKPITPKRVEVLINARSRSAKLRVGEKI